MSVLVRIQRKRTWGWRMPPNTVYVGRPSIYGNPFGRSRAASAVFKHWLLDPTYIGYHLFPIAKDMLMGALYDDEALHGRNLVCWCRLCSAHAAGKPFDVVCADCEPCHADVLGQIANQEVRS